MIPSLGSILPLLETFYKKAVPTCPHCGNADGCTKWCWYRRYDHGRNRRIRVQRYLCPNGNCPAVTFSILPFGFLPFVRLSFRALWLLTAIAQVFSVNSLATIFDCSRATIRRRVSCGRKLFAWLTANLVSMRDISWNTFCGLVFARFYPTTNAEISTNTTWPIMHQEPIS